MTMHSALALLFGCAVTCNAIRLNYEPHPANLEQKFRDSDMVEGKLIPWHCTWNATCADYNPYEDLQCNKAELATIRIESKKQKGLIASGQGGSATRVTQQISEIVGTYNWGDVDDVTKDSWSVRWGGAFLRHTEVFKNTGRVDYDPATALPAKLLVEVEDSICKTLMIADRMAHREENYKPWALKEPWLRTLLPMFMEVVDFKFIHVTRDIRCVSKTYHEEKAYDDVKLFAERDLFVKYADEQLANHAIELARTDSSASQKLLSPAKLTNLKQALKSGTWTPQEEKWIKFTHVWAAVEHRLHTWWTTERPDDYFHMAEHTVPAPDNMDKAQKFAAFLGEPNPSKSTMDKMSNVYTPSNCNQDHWNFMQRIITSPMQKEVKDTMQMLGYYI